MLQKQARHYAVHLGIGNFAASNGWLANFRRFYNIVSVSCINYLFNITQLPIVAYPLLLTRENDNRSNGMHMWPHKLKSDLISYSI